MRLNFPDQLNPQKVFYLMITRFPNGLSESEIVNLDFAARHAFEEGDFVHALPLEVLAAKGHATIDSPTINLNQGFCWDRAAKSAYEMIEKDYYFAFIEVGCAYNAASIYHSVLEGKLSEQIKESKRLTLAQRGLDFLLKTLDKARINFGAFRQGADAAGLDIVPEFYDWFTQGREYRKIA